MFYNEDMEKVKVFEVEIAKQEFKEAELLISGDEEADENYKDGFIDAINFFRRVMDQHPQHLVFNLYETEVKCREQ